jgi:hypothetical protein
MINFVKIDSADTILYLRVLKISPRNFHITRIIFAKILYIVSLLNTI